MDKNLTAQQSSQVAQVGGKHSVFPHTRAGWVVTGVTAVGSIIVCAVSHFDGGAELGSLFVTLTVSGFSDDTIHALLYGKRFPGHLAMNNGKSAGKWFQELAADFAERWLGFERNPHKGESFKSWAARWLGMPVYDEPTTVEGAIVEETAEPLVDAQEVSTAQPRTGQNAGLTFGQAATREEVKVARLTIEQIVAHIEPNGFKVYIGRSLTKDGNPPVQIGFYKQHFKFIGASQKGKSAMAAAFLDIVTRTHDPEHVLIALLDLEDQTSKLFADLPHVAEVATDKGTYSLHARNHEEVLHRLRLLMLIMDERYGMDKSQILQEPILLVYVEEFLALKDYFKNRINGLKGDEKRQAEKDYADLIFCISEIARRGLKVRVQLLLCAQVDYRDEDFQEALINVGAGMSFCVRPTAAQAAGFYNAELLSRNVKDDTVGQAVVQMPDCKDLVLAPEYDLEQKLIALEEADMKWGTRKVDSILASAKGHKQNAARADRGLRLVESGFEEQPYPRMAVTRNDLTSSIGEENDFDIYAQRNSENEPVERTQENAKYRLDNIQLELFCVAYELTGNIDDSLKRSGAHTGYRQHARQVIAERNLKRSN